MLVKISPLSFHGHALRRCRHHPICLWSSSVHTGTSHVSTRQRSLCVSGTLSIAWYSRKNSQQDFSSLSLEAINKVVWIPCQCTLCTTAWMESCVMLRQVNSSHRWWVCIKLYHVEISPKQGASKVVKISQQVAKLCRKLKWLLFFWDTVYMPQAQGLKTHCTAAKIKLKSYYSNKCIKYCIWKDLL